MPSQLVAVVSALVPAAFAWWSGRDLARRAEDPALPEMLLARQQRLSIITALSLVLTGFLAGYALWWAAPLALVAIILADHPLRRGLFGETWGLGAYLEASLRMIAAGFGFPLLLALSPVMILASAPFDLVMAVALAASMLFWLFTQGRIWLRLLRTTPLESPDLRERFDAIVARAGVPAPAVVRFGFRGGRIANAFVLPRTDGATIAIGDTLLEILDPDELAAIFAHEVSHLEHYTPRQVRKGQLAGIVLVLLTVSLPIVATRLVPEWSWLATIWPLLIFTALAIKATRLRAHETESDLRAATLCGDSEALVRALVKIHAFSRLPRRWAHEVERAATHPSLARRIQALRTAAEPRGEVVPSAHAQPVVLRSGMAGSYVILDVAHAHWLEGVVGEGELDAESLRARARSVRTFGYEALSELRVATRGGTRWIVATDEAGERWWTTLDPSDVGAAQRTLDAVDQRLGQRAPRPSGVMARALAGVIVLALLLTGHIGAALVPPLLVLWRPGAAALAATGALALARVIVVAVWWAGVRPAPAWMIALPLLVLCGGASLVLADRWRRLAPAGETPVVLLLGVLAMLGIGRASYSAWQGGLAWLAADPGLLLLCLTMLGLSAALFMSAQPQSKRAAVACGAVATAAGVVWIGVESIAPASRRLTWTEGRAAAIASASADGFPSALRLSPDASHFAVQTYRTDESDETLEFPFVVGRFGGTSRRVDAVDMTFVDESSMLVLRHRNDGFELREEGVNMASISWRVTLPALVDAELAVDRDSRRWRVVGLDPRSNEIVAISGTVGNAGKSYARWGVDRMYPVDTRFIPLHGGSSMLMTARDSRDIVRTPRALLSGPAERWTVWRLDSAGMQVVARLPGFPHCAPSAAGDGAVCVVSRARNARVWSVGQAGELRILGTLPGVRRVATVEPGGAVTAARHDAIMLADIRARRGARLSMPDADQRGVAPIEVVASGDRVAVLRLGDGESWRVTLYRPLPLRASGN